VLSDECKLPAVSSNQDYAVPSHLLLEEVYKKWFNNDPDSNDLYAIAYYNNRKVIEGHSQYHVIDPISLDVKRGWTIFIPPQQWIDEYKKFPATIPQPAKIETSLKLYVSGSSTLSHLSAQMAKCSADVVGVKLVWSGAGNTASGLRDLCQGKADMFGANGEIASESGCPEMEKFEVARYVMVVFINKNNPSAVAIEKNPLSDKELADLLIDAYLWRNVRGSLDNSETVRRHYLSLESGEFEIVKDGIFPGATMFNILGLNIHFDKHSYLQSYLFFELVQK